jgi:hypothetical protein
MATSTLNSIRLSSGHGSTTLLVVFSTGLGFYVIDALYRDVARSEMMVSRTSKDAFTHAQQQTHQRMSAALVAAVKLSTTLQTLQSVGIIMFTNSLVTWCMELISSGKGGIGNAFATIVAGVVVARAVVQIVDAGTEHG